MATNAGLFIIVTDAITIVKKMYCTRRDSNSVPLVYETIALPIELNGIPSSRDSIKQVVRTNTCDMCTVTLTLKK